MANFIDDIPYLPPPEVIDRDDGGCDLVFDLSDDYKDWFANNFGSTNEFDPDEFRQFVLDALTHALDRMA